MQQAGSVPCLLPPATGHDHFFGIISNDYNVQIKADI
jgi:hypothetical protein